MGHPHLVTDVDNLAIERLQAFISDHNTQAIVVEGTQGTGKTNLLEYYKRELAEIYSADEGVYIVRYYADPEPDFGAVVRRIMQEFGVQHLVRVSKALAVYPESERASLLANVQNPELRAAFARLARDTSVDLEHRAELLLEYLMGLRVFKRHTEETGVQFRLDTTESKTQAMHDLVYLSLDVGCFKALFLFLDELEKQGAQSLTVVVRYLSAIRALIDALPKHLFLLLAMTPDARRRYSQMLPALAGRLEQTISLPPIQSPDDALRLYRFYLEEKRAVAKAEAETVNWRAGTLDPLSDIRVTESYDVLNVAASRMGIKGVTQRSLLDKFHSETESLVARLV